MKPNPIKNGMKSPWHTVEEILHQFVYGFSPYNPIIYSIS